MNPIIFKQGEYITKSELDEFAKYSPLVYLDDRIRTAKSSAGVAQGLESLQDVFPTFIQIADTSYYQYVGDVTKDCAMRIIDFNIPLPLQLILKKYFKKQFKKFDIEIKKVFDIRLNVKFYVYVYADCIVERLQGEKMNLKHFDNVYLFLSPKPNPNQDKINILTHEIIDLNFLINRFVINDCNDYQIINDLHKLLIVKKYLNERIKYYEGQNK